MRIVVFHEPEFPVLDSVPVPQAQWKRALGKYTVRMARADALADALSEQPDLVILPHGSAFPKSAWPAFTAYLKRGGRWLNLGGAPLTRPVRREKGRWIAEEHQVAYGKECMIRHTWPVDLPTGTRFQVSEREVAIEPIRKAATTLPAHRIERLWSLQVLLTESGTLCASDPGASGMRRADFRPVVQAMSREGTMLGAGVVVIDMRHGTFEGGRWVLVPCCPGKPFSAGFLKAVCDIALQPAVCLEVRPGFGCYYPGESATAIIRVSSRCRDALEIRYRIIEADSGRVIRQAGYRTTCGVSDSYVTTPAIPLRRSGLYSVCVTARLAGQETILATAENGFWLYDERFMASAQPLTINRDYFLRGGKPFPLTGTTYMSTATHRSWMIEPTATAWDRDFAAMKAAGINIVRTGFWWGWRRMMAEPGVMDEGVVRALQAFLLAARRHDMPVILTVFAFLPETWSGTNPYVDPAALSAQSTFLSALARRLSSANHLLWDFINEPSYAHPQGLWSFRPSGDSAEAAAWAAWLKKQGASEDEWRTRWGLTTNSPLSVPAQKELGDLHHQDDSRLLRATDFVRFSQDAFTEWVRRMRDVIRANGNPNQLVTVGQDEAGAGRSPNPHFHAEDVDFTSNHPWWLNDDTLWDSVMTKTDLCPNVLEEAGVMFAEGIRGRPQRSPERVRDLLERKMALSFAGGCAGFIQWLWNTAVYNFSENEAGIGLLRADGSAKPELAALSGVAAFMRRVARHMEARETERVVLIIPHSQLFSVRNTATECTRRAVRALEYRLGVACRTVSEMFPERAGEADLLVLPSPRILREDCWQALLRKVHGGATLLASGYIEDDEYWRPVARLKRFGLETYPAEVDHEEQMVLPLQCHGGALRMAFSSQLWYEKAVGASGESLPLQSFQYGKGHLLYCPVPIECTLAEDHTEAVYREACRLARLPCATPEEGAGPGLLIRAVTFRKAGLFLVSNESGVVQNAVLRGEALVGVNPQWRLSVTIPAGRSCLFLVDRAKGVMLDSHMPG